MEGNPGAEDPGRRNCSSIAASRCYWLPPAMAAAAPARSATSVRSMAR